MKRFFAFNVLVKLLLVLFITNSNAATVKGAASVYKVTMTKLELCTASTGVTVCTGAVVIGEGAKVVDIAAADAGAVAGAYGKATLLPLGVTYTHMRVTIDRKFTISAGLTVSDVTADCNTTGDLSGSSYPGGSLSSNEKYDRLPVEDDGQTQAEAEVYLKNDQMKTCTAADCSGVSAANDITYGQGTGSSTYQTQHANGSTSDDHVMIYALSSSYTVSLIPPTIDISFGTSEAIKATEVGTDLCMFDPQEPVVTITMK